MNFTGEPSPAMDGVMMNTTDRYPDNTAGNWFVNEQCICCGLCEELAPDSFRESDDGDHHIVYQQPEGVEQLAQAEEAREQCPVEAIHKEDA